MSTSLHRHAGVDLAKAARATLWLGAVLVVAFAAFLIVRPTGSYNTPLDGWGVAAFELAMGGTCIARYFDAHWRRGDSVARAFPLVLGASCVAWGLGDMALTVESLGGASPSTPSVADGFYVAFFPICFVSFTMVIRRGNKGSLVATSLDGLIAGFGAASLSAAFVFETVRTADGGDALSAATNLAYPVGDLLLLALAVGGMTILPKEYRRFLAIAGVAMAANCVGDLFHLMQPDSRIGYVADALAWPVSLLMLAVAGWAQPTTAPNRRVSADRMTTERRAGFVLPAAGALAGMAVLLAASIGHVGKDGVDLATATLLVAGVRLALTVREAQALTSARFRSLIDNAWDLIVVAEVDLEIAYVTPSSRRVLGLAPGELQGRVITTLVHPDDTDTLVDALRGLAADSQLATFETRIRNSEGAWRIIAWTATNLLDDPSVRGYVLNGGDVTEARRAAEDLAAARDGALLASKAKSEFLSTMSHEIRTPMNGVIGLTELLLRTALDADQHELVSGVMVSAENLLVIINDILDFSKIEAGELEIEHAEIKVADVADDVGRILAASAHAKGLELLVDVHPDVPSALLGDKVRIQQVLLNLAANAVKFTLDGEVVIRVSMLAANTDRVALRFDVIDTGIGIAPGDQQRLFRPFAQADSSTTRKFGGTGLGLAICRQLVELMGGRLDLVSAPGRGSTFWFELSLARTESASAPARSQDTTIAGHRTLIVDDNATNRKILRQQLRAWGIDAVEAVDAEHALGLAAAAAQAGQPFDVGVIDLNMPGMDGIELAAALSADPATTEITLFLLSSSGQRLTSAEAHLRGFAATMTKPVRPSELFDCLVSNLDEGVDPIADSPAAIQRPDSSEVMGVILLVEDNTVNQLVGSRILANLGYDFDVANHGGEAVAAVRERRYDAILMDCQMPEMDGYEATAAIRRIEGTTAHTPIIAMTAAAMEGDREACLTAGMDDYITKPARPPAIAAALQRWIPSSAPAVADDSTRPPREPTAAETLDATQIEVLRSLDDGHGAVLNAIIDQYLTTTAQGRARLAEIVNDGDAEALMRAAHTLKGASANVGATALTALCAEIESRSRASELDAAAELVARFDTEFARVRDAFSQLVGS